MSYLSCSCFLCFDINCYECGTFVAVYLAVLLLVPLGTPSGLGVVSECHAGVPGCSMCRTVQLRSLSECGVTV